MVIEINPIDLNNLPYVPIQNNSIALIGRDFKGKVHDKIQQLLNDISNVSFKTPDGTTFKISEINKKVPIYLDKKDTISNKRIIKITKGELIRWKTDLSWEIEALEGMLTENNKLKLEHLRGLYGFLENELNKFNQNNPNASSNALITITCKTERLGYYTRNGKGNNPEIVLFMDSLGNKESDSNRVAITLIHEMFHAFYDSDLQETVTHIPFVEEPLTEFAMLKFVEFLAESDSKYVDLQNDAIKEVYCKQFSCGLAHYGFGHYLYEQAPWYRYNWIDIYRKAKYGISTGTDAYKNFSDTFEKGKYPFSQEYYFQDLLKVILENANGKKLQLPNCNHSFNSGLMWHKIGQSAYWAISNKKLYLDGFFDNTVFCYSHIIPSCYTKVVFCEHFVCEECSFFKLYQILTNSKRLTIENRSWFYYQDLNGVIYSRDHQTRYWVP